MPVPVVDALEAVEVQEQRAGALPGTRVARQGRAQPLLEQRAVRQPGQRVAHGPLRQHGGQVTQLLLGVAALGDVLGADGVPRRPALRSEDGGHAVQQPACRAVRQDVLLLGLGRAGRTGEQALHLRVRVPDDLLEGDADQVLGGSAEQRGVGLVHPHVAAGEVRQGQPDPGGLEEGLKDVLVDGESVHRLAGGARPLAAGHRFRGRRGRAWRGDHLVRPAPFARRSPSRPGEV